jgi:hypothetical protein
MALNSLFTNKKFNRLSRLLKMPKPYILGHLEYLWHASYSNCNPNVGNNLDIEGTAEWVGEDGVLTTALRDAGFIDEIGDTGEFFIHDWEEHVPPYVRKKLARRKQLAGQQETNGRPMGDQLQDSGSGEGKGKERKGKEKKRKVLQRPEYSEQFLRFWELYPRKTDKKDAFETWNGGGLDEKVLLVISKLSPYVNEVKDTEKRFIKHPKRWLNSEDWDDIPIVNSLPLLTKPKLKRTKFIDADGNTKFLVTEE